MSLVVVFRQTALRSLARIRNEDKDLFAQARQAIVLWRHHGGVRPSSCPVHRAS
jgi:hypothetical protein